MKNNKGSRNRGEKVTMEIQNNQEAINKTAK